MTTLAEKLHEWYLEATKELNPESFNPNAQKEYSELTEEQKFIDRFIAQKVLEKANEDFNKKIDELKEFVLNKGDINYSELLELFPEQRLKE